MVSGNAGFDWQNAGDVYKKEVGSGARGRRGLKSYPTQTHRFGWKVTLPRAFST